MDYEYLVVQLAQEIGHLFLESSHPPVVYFLIHQTSLIVINLSFPGFTRSKIVCTIGPASSSPKVLDKMIDAGMDVARINMSHGSPEEHRPVIEYLRKVGNCGILVDLPGPKIRLEAHFNNLHSCSQDCRADTGLIPAIYIYIYISLSLSFSFFVATLPRGHSLGRALSTIGSI